MKINPEIFKAYDIRGIYPDDINKDNFATIIKAIYTLFVKDLQKDKLQIVLARDMRLSSPSLFNIAKETLVALGATVIDIGLASTPTLYFASLKYGYDAGILVSASHNPPEYNGIKFVKRVGNKIIKIGKNTGMNKVREYATSGKFVKKQTSGKVIKKQDVLKDELDFTFDIVKSKNIKKIKVVADPANAMGILYLEELFKRLPCELVRMNFKLDGTFPAHHPDPLKFYTLKDIQKRVVAERADLGIAPDGDGDRIFFIDEKGEIIPATAITSILAKEILQDKAGETIIVDVRYTRNPRQVIKEYNGKMSESVVGHALISKQLNDENAAFAGESSGHFFFRENGGGEASIRVILELLEVIGRENKPVSQIVADVTSYVESGEFNFTLKEGTTKDRVFAYFAKEYKDADRIYYLDGITVEYPKWRFNIRASNTEPLIRLNLEGQSRELVDKKLKEISDKIIKQGAKPKNG